MPTKYQLHPTDLIVETVGDRTDSLRQISWTYIGVSENNQYVAEFHDCTHVSSSATSDENYIAFSDLQANTVLAWIDHDLDNTIAAHYESELTLREYAEQQIENDIYHQENIQFTNHEMPWFAPAGGEPSADAEEETPE
jgi:hypothetical protein